jgi:hypothetical protein
MFEPSRVVIIASAYGALAAAAAAVATQLWRFGRAGGCSATHTGR